MFGHLKNNIKNNEYWTEELSELVNDSDVILHVGADSNTQNFDLMMYFFITTIFQKYCLILLVKVIMIIKQFTHLVQVLWNTRNARNDICMVQVFS